jgi:hypothetical protein
MFATMIIRRKASPDAVHFTCRKVHSENKVSGGKQSKAEAAGY